MTLWKQRKRFLLVIQMHERERGEERMIENPKEEKKKGDGKRLEPRADDCIKWEFSQFTSHTHTHTHTYIMYISIHFISFYCFILYYTINRTVY